jgi:hypothetical protein
LIASHEILLNHAKSTLSLKKILSSPGTKVEIAYHCHGGCQVFMLIVLSTGGVIIEVFDILSLVDSLSMFCAITLFQGPTKCGSIKQTKKIERCSDLDERNQDEPQYSSE